MNCVSLVGTVHDELGRVNASELCAILERIRPEVIFLEVPLAAFDDYYVMCRRSNLESIAVRRYRESQRAGVAVGAAIMQRISSCHDSPLLVARRPLSDKQGPWLLLSDKRWLFAEPSSIH